MLLLTVNQFQISILSNKGFLRRSHSQMFFKIGVPKNFANFTGKHQCWSLFYEVAGLRFVTLLKRASNTGVFL